MIIKKTMIITIGIVLAVGLAGILFLQQESFGQQPQGKRLDRMKASPNFKNGKFQNLSETPLFQNKPRGP